MLEVNFYAYFYSEDEDPKESRKYLRDFWKSSTPLLQHFGYYFHIVWEKHPLAPEPNDLKHSYPAEGWLKMPFRFQYMNLEDAHRKVHLLESLLDEMAKRNYFEFRCEYHLDDDDMCD